MISPMKKLISRTEFAKIAQVTQGAVTRAAKTSLSEAVDGKYIDLNHAAAQEFIKKNHEAKTPEPLPGIDPLYEKAVELCQNMDRWSANLIKHNLNVGSTRATKIFNQIIAAGVKEKFEREGKVLAAAPIPKTPHVRGTQAAKQKRIAADVEELEEIELPENIIAFADMTIRDVIRKYGTAERFVDYLKALKEIGIMAEREIKLAEMKGELVSRRLVQTRVIEEFDAAHIKLLRDGSKTIAVQVAAMVSAGESIEDIEKTIAGKITDFIRPAKSKIEKALRDV